MFLINLFQMYKLHHSSDIVTIHIHYFIYENKIKVMKQFCDLVSISFLIHLLNNKKNLELKGISNPICYLTTTICIRIS